MSFTHVPAFSAASVFTVPVCTSRARWQPDAETKVLATGSTGDRPNQVCLRDVDMSRMSRDDDQLSEPLSDPLATAPHKGDVTELRWLSASTLATTSTAGHVNLYQLSGRGIHDGLSQVGAHSLHSGPATALATSEGRVLSGGEDGALRLLDVNSGKVVRALDKASTSSVHCMTFRSPGQVLVGGLGGRLLLFDLRSASERPATVCLDEHSSAVTAMAQHPARVDTIATGSSNGTFSTWDLRGSPVPVCSFSDRQCAIWDVKFLPQLPTTLLTCGEDGGVKAWDFNQDRGDPVNVQYTREQKANTHCFDIASSEMQCNSLDIHSDGVSVLGASDSRAVLHFRQVFRN